METKDGVMSSKYARQRKSKRHLRFRYRVRARMAVEAYSERCKTKGTNTDVVELGAAEGATLVHVRRLLDLPGRCVGVEYSAELINCASRLPTGVDLIEGDITNLHDTLDAETFDLATLLATLEHLENPRRALKEAFRLLRPGGVLVATAPAPMWDRIAGVFGLVEDEYHETEMTEEVLRSLLVDTGFVDIDYRRFMWAVSGTLPYLDIPVTPECSMHIDKIIRRMKVLDFSFVNQMVVGRKPKRMSRNQ